MAKASEIIQVEIGHLYAEEKKKVSELRKQVSKLLQENESYMEIVGQQRVYINTLTAALWAAENRRGN